MYAPLGTSMTLGDYVRLSIAFLDIFKAADAHTNTQPNVVTTADQPDFSVSEVSQLRNDLKVRPENTFL